MPRGKLAVDAGWWRWFADEDASDVRETVERREQILAARPFIVELRSQIQHRARDCKWRPGMALEQAGAMQIALSVYTDLLDYLDKVVQSVGEG